MCLWVGVCGGRGGVGLIVRGACVVGGCWCGGGGVHVHVCTYTLSTSELKNR